jgi:hypothetical protein
LTRGGTPQVCLTTFGRSFLSWYCSSCPPPPPSVTPTRHNVDLHRHPSHSNREERRELVGGGWSWRLSNLGIDLYRRIETFSIRTADCQEGNPSYYCLLYSVKSFRPEFSLRSNRAVRKLVLLPTERERERERERDIFYFLCSAPQPDLHLCRNCGSDDGA